MLFNECGLMVRRAETIFAFLRHFGAKFRKTATKTTCKLETATAQRTRPRAVVCAPRRAAWQLKSALRHSVSASPRTIIFFIFFTIIAGELFLYVQQWLVIK